MKKFKKTAVAVKNVFKKERSLFSLLVIPMYFLVIYVVRDLYEIIPFSWEEFTGLTVVLILSASLLSLFFSLKFFSKEEVLKGMIISLSTYILLLKDIFFSDISNVVYNIALWATLLLIVVFFIIEIYSIIKRSYGGIYHAIDVIIFTFALIVAVLFIENVVDDFGTQWIWTDVLPLGVLLLFLSIFIDEKDIFFKFDDESFFSLLRIIMLLAFATGIISTLYQFWFSEIVFGYNLWQTLVSVVVIVIFLLVLIGSIRSYREKKTLQKLTEEEERRIEEERKTREIELKREKERLVKLRNSIKEKILNSSLEKEDVYRAIGTFSFSGNEDLFLEIFLNFNLIKLFQVSVGKHKLIWSPKIISVFNLLEIILKKTNDDYILKGLSYEIYFFELNLLTYKDFEGFSSLKEDPSYETFWGVVKEGVSIYNRLHTEEK